MKRGSHVKRSPSPFRRNPRKKSRDSSGSRQSNSPLRVKEPRSKIRRDSNKNECRIKSKTPVVINENVKSDDIENNRRSRSKSNTTLQETNNGLSKLGFPCDNDDKNKSPDIKRSASSFPVNDPTETRVEANASVNDCTKQDVKKIRSKSKKKKEKKVKKKKKNKDIDPLS